jgi:Transposase DDE domain
LVDATTLSAPGSGGTDWRVHVAYDLVAQRIAAVALSDRRGAESLRNFAWAPGDLAVGDRGYAKARDLAAVAKAGADFIVRAGWNALRLRAHDDAPFDLFAALDRVPELGDTAFEIAVALNRAGTKWLPARLVVLRKSAADAEASRDEARRKSRRQGKAVQPETLKAAGYILLITSLEHETAADILALYRLRWQVELVFKRLKSLLNLDALPAKDADLARTWIYAKLIAALLLEDVTNDILDISP